MSLFTRHTPIIVVIFFFFIFLGEKKCVSSPTSKTEIRNPQPVSVYPVQLTTQLIPPFSGYLPDYAAPDVEKLKLLITNNDLAQPDLDVKLKVRIEGINNNVIIQSKTFYYSPAIYLQAGVPQLISGADLAELLDYKNLDFSGINVNDYLTRKVLPEGLYKICITAYKANSAFNEKVSEESCVMAWFTLNDPPFLNFPSCNSVITPTTPQQITFSWTPMNTGSPNSAMNTEYLVELWELQPNGVDPNNFVFTAPPIYSTTLDFTLFSYGITEPQLTQGKEYAWRVKAIDKTGRDYFKNKGYSQVCTFSYGSKYANINLGINLQAQDLGPRQAKTWWTASPVVANFKVEIRKQQNSWWTSISDSCKTLEKKLFDLEPNTDYVVRVQGSNEEIESPWSNEATFKTPPLPVIKCDEVNPPQPTISTNPLLSATPGMIFRVGQFDMEVVSIKGQNGYFTGTGKIFIPFMVTTLGVKYNNLYVDENRLTKGKVEGLTSGIEKWEKQVAQNKAEYDATYIDGVIDSAKVKNGQICIYANGNQTPEKCLDLPKDGNVLVVRDGEGNQYTVSPDGTIKKTNYLYTSTDTLDASDTLQVTFSQSASQQFGFDEKQYAVWASNYEAIKLNNNKTYFVPFKSIGENNTDEVIANILINNFNPDKLKFKIKSGLNLDVTKTGTTYTIKVPADAECVYAYYDFKKIGKLNVINLKALPKKVVLVPINGATISSVTIQNELNKIYAVANVRWTTTVAANFNFDLGQDGLEAADATLMTKYSIEMRSLRDAYKNSDSTYDKKAYYLFVVNNFTDPSMQGYMPRGRALGFIKETADGKAIAHELAHGAFGLEHTFPQIEQGKSNNLLDYGTDDHLTKMQWGDIHSSLPLFSWMDGEEDAKLVDDSKYIFWLLSEIKRAYKNNTSINITKEMASLIPARLEDRCLAGIRYEYIGVYAKKPTTISPQNKITMTFDTSYRAVFPTGMQLVTSPCIDVDGVVKILVPENMRYYMKRYLESTAPDRNILLFVNGYRLRDDLQQLEFPKGPDIVYTGDVTNYWSGIDARFINSIHSTTTILYADGHHSIKTSNHYSLSRFGKSLASVKAANSYLTAFGDLYADEECYHNAKCVTLNSEPRNKEGFDERVKNGKSVGEDMVKKLKTGLIPCRKDLEGNIIDIVDIVAHSFGFAYSLGIIEVLKANNIKLGRYYVLAPENACSGTINLNDFEEAWQYGSDEAKDPVWAQDGVAVQCGIGGLPDANRIYLPDYCKKDFIESHLVKNYTWIFDKNIGEKGYVQKRK